MAITINGFLMSFLDVLRSLAEQVAIGVGLMIKSVSTPLMLNEFAVSVMEALSTMTIR